MIFYVDEDPVIIVPFYYGIIVPILRKKWQKLKKLAVQRQVFKSRRSLPMVDF